MQAVDDGNRVATCAASTIDPVTESGVEPLCNLGSAMLFFELRREELEHAITPVEFLEERGVLESRLLRQVAEMLLVRDGAHAQKSCTQLRIMINANACCISICNANQR